MSTIVDSYFYSFAFNIEPWVRYMGGARALDFANCCIFLLIVLMYLNGWSLVMQG